MLTIPLSDITADMIDLVGGKAAGLGELIRHGERVPPGFCITTRNHGRPAPTADILAAHQRLGPGPVAVRSSATAEDLPDASFAGQQDTYLDVTGPADLLAAVDACRASLYSPRATAYRDAHHIDHDTVRMAVVVQQMINPTVAGVLFTANPLTGCRTQMLVEAAPGLGTTVVDGATDVDHYLLDGPEHSATGCLTPAQLADLHSLGTRLQHHFNAPQDVEWAMDHDGTLWVLQTRPITTLFPAPPPTDRPQPRVYLEFGHVQGMLQPATPMGMSTLKTVIAAMLATLGVRADIIDIGGRLYGDLTDLTRNPATRKRLIKLMAVDFGPRAQTVMQHVLADPRFAPQPDTTTHTRTTGSSTARTTGRAATGILRALARPDAARARLHDAVDRIRRTSVPPTDLTSPADRLRFVREQSGAESDDDQLIWPIAAGMLAAVLPEHLLKGIAEPQEIQTVLGGMPHNVTIEMNLALWRLAQHATEHRQLLLDTPAPELATRYRQGTLPDIGLAPFLHTYGHRGVAEVDLGVPRWDENPTPVFAMIANYLRITDPEQAPDRRFTRAAATAEATLTDLTVRARRRPVRGRIAVFLLRRARSLAGLREAGKFAGLYRLREMRRQLLLIGAHLADAALLEHPDDIMFLTLDEVHDAVHHHADHRSTVTARRATHHRETRRRTVPVALLSDGTDLETVLPPAPTPDGALRGVGAAPGRVTGPARIVHDPATARIEPGDVIVAATTDPGWTPLFLTAGALVTETGMAHGPTVAREYGIPAVICVRNATRAITTGQIVTVDGAAGTVSTADTPAADNASTL
ncbi:PEP/pyruvate-binding domain-containing protein [Verrucosispora sp. WMMD573]|uniref:PEP/pyruvate-binding domain-containing protein n=1 Tax=Verrucosispora sp. WMMD573 TaxID=3015149 RepID=UPI00248C6A66|nr:PEP/pyruvate-binding domain-containing protein [Verrucosispora sp. WMMD573]WBB53119.1 PEP-utilizing enzyme [Verrucosispora sp. WMMD573]